ncbi:MAG TPA: carboxymuconolactone decarboxylase family protein [Actinomycetota bacterium]|nr:carboxymuconolactone decarboxylase family protein [Actinomycetota bacterium]
MDTGELFSNGIQTRREVLGDPYVDGSLEESDEFFITYQRLVTELAWGYAWSRPGLDVRVRCMISIAMLTALGRYEELAIYTKGALDNGVTVEEIREILVQATIYCGTPVGRQSFLAVDKVLQAERKK